MAIRRTPPVPSDGEKVWIVYDGRAADGDTDNASVLQTCESEKEARQVVRSNIFGRGAVYYEYTFHNGIAEDESGPFFGED